MNFARSPFLVGPRRKKPDHSQRSVFPSETSRLTFDSSAKGFSTPLARRAALRPSRIWCVLTRYCRALLRPTRLSATVPPASRVSPPPEGHQVGARKRRVPGSTILNQPYRRRISPDRLNREDSQLTTSLEGDPGPTPAGKTLPHSHPKNQVSEG